MQKHVSLNNMFKRYSFLFIIIHVYVVLIRTILMPIRRQLIISSLNLYRKIKILLWEFLKQIGESSRIGYKIPIGYARNVLEIND